MIALLNDWRGRGVDYSRWDVYDPAKMSASTIRDRARRQIYSASNNPQTTPTAEALRALRTWLNGREMYGPGSEWARRSETQAKEKVTLALMTDGQPNDMSALVREMGAFADPSARRVFAEDASAGSFLVTMICALHRRNSYSAVRPIYRGLAWWDSGVLVYS